MKVFMDIEKKKVHQKQVHHFNKLRKSVPAVAHVMSSDAALHKTHVMQSSITRCHRKLC